PSGGGRPGRVPAGRPPAGRDAARPGRRAPDQDRYRPGSGRRPRSTSREGLLRADAGQGAASDATDQGPGGGRSLSPRDPRRGHRRAVVVLGPSARRSRRPSPPRAASRLRSIVTGSRRLLSPLWSLQSNHAKTQKSLPPTPSRSVLRRNWPARLSAEVVARSSTPRSPILSVARAAVTTGTTFCAGCSMSADWPFHLRSRSRTRSSAGAVSFTLITSPPPTA